MLDLNREFPVIPGDLLPDNITRELQTQLSRLLGRRSNTFIGSQPVSFTKEHLDANLHRRDYLVCEKSDGLRCLMLNTSDPNGAEATILITRENQFFLVPGFHFPVPDDQEKFHTNTLIDGELVLSERADGNGKELKYLMFDCLLMNGQSLISLPLQKRLGKLKYFFYDPYSKFCQSQPQFAQENNRFKVRMKDMKTSYNLWSVLEAAKTQAHVSDGLIFTCAETHYMFGTDVTLLKWKPSEENTIDFKMELHWPTFVDPDLDEHHPDKTYLDYDAVPEVSLHVWQGDNDQTGESKYERFPYDLTITEAEWTELKELGEPLDGRIVECHKNVQGEWKFLRFRDDKSNGNHKSTVDKVLVSIEDGVTKEELIKACAGLKAAWKEREAKRHAHSQPSHSTASNGSRSSAEEEHKRRQQLEERRAREQREHQQRQQEKEREESVPKYDKNDSDEDHDSEWYNNDDEGEGEWFAGPENDEGPTGSMDEEDPDDL
ncbi:hypothetical protein WICPIJ_000362 [Wickerhamomyces pijperi]|uniref:mRNA-capping enzyme subunit alpha n=1 Tax=Wickerhamomyces pijperi TaxID=599730 RepID=A0A9P8TSR4_WICPI|nr:hypothetical protein WICPIJ_000362 [Wickerhamomyces pijperi]